MTDRQFLCWIHERLQHTKGDSPLESFMHRLRRIIAVTPKDQETLTSIRSYNSLEVLFENLGNDTIPKTP